MRHLPAILAAAMLAACAPVTIDAGRGAAEAPPEQSEVAFHLDDAYRAAPPDCVAVMPFAGAEGVAPDDAERVRRAVFAHLAPQGKRDVELQRVDTVLARLGERRSELAAVAEGLRCGTLLRGRVSEYGHQFYGVYSRVAVGASLTMVRGADGAVLWEGRHLAASHGGSLPLSPIGLAMGMLDAAHNMEEEQLLRSTDDLARRLVATIPDDRIASLDDPAAPPSPVTLAPPPPLPPVPPPTAAGHVATAEQLMAAGDWSAALAEVEAAITLDGKLAEAHFLRARALIKLGEPVKAEPAILTAIALDGTNPRYLDALGYLNSTAGRTERALAAYHMAIDADPADGFAWYNSGVLLLDQGDAAGAADAFYGAGLAYLKRGNFGQAGKALADLRELSGQGLPLSTEIDTLAGALERLAAKGGSP
ncbi:MAG: tetratricopeptide repeat protein [Magnetospirillum sp.]|nr:MAG: tetratricopeptide repeat protein [Magnetospirillum sp.]